MSAAVAVIIEAAARIGAPVLKTILADRLGGAGAEIGGVIVDAIAERAGVPKGSIEKLPPEQLDQAVLEVEKTMPLILADYNQAQRETNRLMLAEMKTDSAFGWMWRPAGMWLMLVCIAWYVFGIPLASGILSVWAGYRVDVVPSVDFGAFGTIFVTFTGLYMGGHTIKAAFRK